MKSRASTHSTWYYVCAWCVFFVVLYITPCNIRTCIIYFIQYMGTYYYYYYYHYFTYAVRVIKKYKILIWKGRPIRMFRARNSSLISYCGPFVSNYAGILLNTTEIPRKLDTRYVIALNNNYIQDFLLKWFITRPCVLRLNIPNLYSLKSLIHRKSSKPY